MTESVPLSLFEDKTIQPAPAVSEHAEPGLFDGTPGLTVMAPAPKRSAPARPAATNPALAAGLFPIPCPDLTADGGFTFTAE